MYNTLRNPYGFYLSKTPPWRLGLLTDLWKRTLSWLQEHLKVHGQSTDTLERMISQI